MVFSCLPTYDNGSGSFGYTNQRYMFSRWNGTAWITPVDITGANVVPSIQPKVNKEAEEQGSRGAGEKKKIPLFYIWYKSLVLPREKIKIFISRSKAREIVRPYLNYFKPLALAMGFLPRSSACLTSNQPTVRGVAVSFPGMGTKGVNGFPLDEPCYTGGCCFDANNPNIVYLVNTVVQNPTNNSDLSSTDPTGIRELQEWRTTDNGLTWSKVRDITTNSLPNIINGRPYSPKNHDGKIAVVWWRGAYSGWVRCFNTNIWCAPASDSYCNPRS